MMAPGLCNPPSRKAWNPKIFTVIGSMRRAASAVRFVHKQKIATTKTRAMTIITYWLFIKRSINWNAWAVLYMSGVGGGNTPIAPRMGVIRRSVRIIFPMSERMEVYFIICFYTNAIQICRQRFLVACGQRGSWVDTWMRGGGDSALLFAPEDKAYRMMSVFTESRRVLE